MLSAKIYLIVTTTFFTVNGKTVDRMETSYVSSAQSYSECNQKIRGKKERFEKDRRAKRDRYSYSYKRITCKSKNIDLGGDDTLKQLLKIKW